jgi:DNA helicase-2/ATP-dependent DNA helicase PcrA
VLLLTVHNAKGLEFDAVAIAGLEEGLMPHASSLESGEQLEEERRLFYVALTRARDEVLLTAAAYRRRYDGARGASVSRFVSEIPGALLEREETAGTWSERERARAGGQGEARLGSWRRRGAGDDLDHDPGNASDSEPMVIPRVGGGRSANARRAVGLRVLHETFGPGTVLEADGDGPNMKLTVRFTGAIKKVLARFVTGVADGD